MPLEELFASRLHFLAEPGTTWGTPGFIAFSEDTMVYEAPDLQIQNLEISGEQGPIPIRIYTPRNIDNGKALVWFHGGAFIGGDLDMNEAHVVSQEIAHKAGAVVISVDYRLVTDDRKLPCAQIDGFDAFAWVSQNAASLGIDSNRIFIGGASAGACLSGAVALLARDAALPVAGVLPIYPIAHWVVPPFSEELQSKMDELPDALKFTHDGTVRLNNNAVGNQLEYAQSKYAFPADAKDKSGLPIHMILNCEYDGLRASGEAWANQLRAAGVTVVEHTQLGAIHGHLNRVPAECATQRETLDVMAEFIRTH